MSAPSTRNVHADNRVQIRKKGDRRRELDTRFRTAVVNFSKETRTHVPERESTLT